MYSFLLSWLEGDKSISEPHNHQRLQERHQKDKIVAEFAGSFCDVRLHCQPKGLHLQVTDKVRDTSSVGYQSGTN